MTVHRDSHRDANVTVAFAAVIGCNLPFHLVAYANWYRRWPESHTRAADNDVNRLAAVSSMRADTRRPPPCLDCNSLHRELSPGAAAPRERCPAVPAAGSHNTKPKN